VSEDVCRGKWLLRCRLFLMWPLVKWFVTIWLLLHLLEFVDFYFILFFDCVLFAWFRLNICLRYFLDELYLLIRILLSTGYLYLSKFGCLQGYRVYLLPYFCDVSLLKILGDRVQWRCSHVVHTVYCSKGSMETPF